MTGEWKIAIDNLLAEWYAVKDDEDLRKVNAFLWQRPQDMLETIECMNIALKHYTDEVARLKDALGKRDVVIKYYDSIIDEQEQELERLRVANKNVDETYSGA